MTDFLNVSV